MRLHTHVRAIKKTNDKLSAGVKLKENDRLTTLKTNLQYRERGDLNALMNIMKRGKLATVTVIWAPRTMTVSIHNLLRVLTMYPLCCFLIALNPLNIQSLITNNQAQVDPIAIITLLTHLYLQQHLSSKMSRHKKRILCHHGKIEV